MSPRPGRKSVTLHETTLEPLTDWRAERRPIPKESQAVEWAIQFFLDASPRAREAWLAKREGKR